MKTAVVWTGITFQTILESEALELSALKIVQIVDENFTCLTAKTPQEMRGRSSDDTNSVVYRLKKLGKSIKVIAEKTGISRSSVKKILDERGKR